jgi:hypothetical protein
MIALFQTLKILQIIPHIKLKRRHYHYWSIGGAIESSSYHHYHHWNIGKGRFDNEYLYVVHTLELAKGQKEKQPRHP